MVTAFPSIQFCDKCYVDNRGVQAEISSPSEDISDLLLLDINWWPIVAFIKGMFNSGIRQNTNERGLSLPVSLSTSKWRNHQGRPSVLWKMIKSGDWLSITICGKWRDYSVMLNNSRHAAKMTGKNKYALSCNFTGETMQN